RSTSIVKSKSASERTMNPPGRPWNEASLSEDPAVAQLERLGWVYVAPETLDLERESHKQVVLTARLGAAIRRLNRWISDDNVRKAVRLVTEAQAASLIEANERLYTMLTHGVALEQDLGDGKKSHTVRFLGLAGAGSSGFG